MLNGKPLLFYTVTASVNSNINRTIVSTNDEEIMTKAKFYGSDVVLRPKKLSINSIGIEPAISHTLDFLKKEENYIPDVIILLQNTSPLRTAKHINEALKLFVEKKFDSIFSAYKSHYFFWRFNGIRSKPINYDPFRRPNRQKMNKEFIENGALYITKYKNFRKFNCRISGKIGIYQMPEELSIQIDNKTDLAIAEQIIKVQQ